MPTVISVWSCDCGVVSALVAGDDAKVYAVVADGRGRASCECETAQDRHLCDHITALLLVMAAPA
jgi:hypothetical protein